MATLTQIKHFIEGTDLLGEVKQDDRDIQSSDLATRQQGWNDLAQAIEKSAEYADLFSDPHSISKNFVTKVQNDAETYLQGITVTVEAFDGNGDTDLLFGGNGSTTAATMWDLVVGAGSPFSVTYNWVWNEYGSSDEFSANWGSVPSTVLSSDESEDRYGIILSQWGTTCASGTGAQWESYMHLHGGDPTALNQDAFLG